MGIVDDDVRRVREESDIVGVVSAHTALKRSGRQWMGLCPFHGEKSPSFSVNAEKNVYYCFGCQRSGDVIGFVEEMEGLDFVGAVEWLAAKANVQLRYTDAADGKRRQWRSTLLDAVEGAAAFYHHRLMEAPDAGPARGYLRDRGYDRAVVERFRLGWAPDGWDDLCRHLQVAAAILEGAGLGFTNRRGRLQDAFRARVMFPILDVNGAPVAFGGRQLPGGPPPKYRNSASNELYDKSKVLYGLSWAKQDAVSAGEIVVCEGYTDVIGFHLAGVGRAVATCGTALTDDHVRLLKRFSNRIVLAFDADAAGQAAADRFYEWERTHDVQVFVADLPEGTDPAEVARSDPPRLRAAVSAALPFLGFRVARALAAGDRSSPEGRARMAERAVAVVAEHPSDLVRDQYLMQVADRLGLDAERLRVQAAAARRRGRAGSSGDAPSEASTEDTPPVPEASRVDESEVLLLRVLADEEPGGSSADRIDPVLFELDTARSVCEGLRSGTGLAELIDSATAGEAALVGRVAAGDAPEDGEAQLAHVARRAALRIRDRLRHEQERRGLDEARQYQPSIDWLGQCVDGLGDPDRRIAIVDHLVPWMRELESREGRGGAAP